MLYALHNTSFTPWQAIERTDFLQFFCQLLVLLRYHVIIHESFFKNQSVRIVGLHMVEPHDSAPKHHVPFTHIWDLMILKVF